MIHTHSLAAGLQETQTPVLGRILNPVTQGFAVGLGGLVAFMPLSQCLVRTAQRVGVLQSFLVAKVQRDVSMRGTLQPNVVVIDAAKVQAVRPCHYLFRPCQRTWLCTPSGAL